MPLELKGLRETRRALAKFAPDLKKEIDAWIKLKLFGSLRKESKTTYDLL